MRKVALPLMVVFLGTAGGGCKKKTPDSAEKSFRYQDQVLQDTTFLLPPEMAQDNSKVPPEYDAI